MKITKLEHACLVLENQLGERLVIDPGNYTRSLGTLESVVAVVVTHKHDDHCDEAQLTELLKVNPGCQIYGPSEVASRLTSYPVISVYHGDSYRVSEFELEFFGDLHQKIHSSIPVLQNVGVLVNRELYYPGDSYTPCDYPVDVLACPSSAPWLRIGDVIDFLHSVRPKRCFPTHNALLSDLGHRVQNGRIKEIVESATGEFRFLQPGDTWDTGTVQIL